MHDRELAREDGAAAAQQEQIDAIAGRLGQMQAAAGKAGGAMAAQREQLEALAQDLERTANALPQDLREAAPAPPGDPEIRLSPQEERTVQARFEALFAEPLPVLDARGGWEAYSHQVEDYFARTGAKRRSLAELLPPVEHRALMEQIRRDFTHKAPQCDRQDYALAAACGLLGALVDVVFVGAPGHGALTKFTDGLADGAVQRFARLCGWEGPKAGKDPVKSAIGFLERAFPVNYDHPHGGAAGSRFSMSTKNHHIKNLAHSPDLMGLFFSILDQFTDTAHFVSEGKLISISTEHFELRGGTLAAKVFCGFANWLGHLFSDLAGSSGATGRGSGIPIPFFGLLQFVTIGEFGQYRQPFSTICVKVFEEGYDLRHGMALAVPVLVTELMTRLCWTLKQKFRHGKDWSDCLPSARDPQLHRMLSVAYGAFCLADAGDAALRSGGQIVAFLLNTNIIAWSRFAVLALHEAQRSLLAGSIDHAAVDCYLETEFARLLANS